MASEQCHICKKTAWIDRARYGFNVRECGRCEKPVCEDCAEVDYDMQGDPAHYVCTQWVCSDRNKCLNAIDLAYIAERQVSEIRALENPTHADYKRIIFGG